MKIISGCSTCQQLWARYSVATSAHLRLENKLQIAVYAHESERVLELAPQVKTAAAERAAARQAIMTHEQDSHATDAADAVAAT